MATGIVSVAAHLLAMPLIARVLLVANALAFLGLSILFIVRAVRYPQAVARDLTSHERAPGFFTVVAGTCVLGVQLAIVQPAPALASGLWILGAALYVLLIYGVLVALIVRRQKPPLTRALGGGWLVAVVATQGVSILGIHVRASFPVASEEMALASLCLWLFGGVLYIWIMGFLLYRELYLAMEAVDLRPSDWIDEGAVAISALAGATLVEASASDPLLASLRPFLAGWTLLFWATATWWIPMLVLFGIWKHVVRRVPLRYEVQLWSFVFPLGMYCVCSVEVATAIGVPELHSIAAVMVYVALGAWAATLVGLVRALARLRG